MTELERAVREAWPGKPIEHLSLSVMRVQLGDAVCAELDDNPGRIEISAYSSVRCETVLLANCDACEYGWMFAIVAARRIARARLREWDRALGGEVE